MKSFEMITREHSTRDFFIKCVSANVYDSTDTKIEFIDVPGALSPGILDTKVLSRLELKIDCVLEHEFVTHAYENVKAWLLRDRIDLPIRLTTHDDYYWEGFVEEITDIQEYNNNIMTFTLNCSCKAYKIYDSDNEEVVTKLSPDATVFSTKHNVTLATPLLRFTKREGMTTFKLFYQFYDYRSRNTKLYDFKLANLASIPNDKEVILDWELGDCYYIGSDKTIVPCNHLIYNFFEEIYSNSFQLYTEGVESLDIRIKPNWRVK